ncbi:P-loop containing nucleoside triphosphate hydrolase protein [Mortierella sp. GBAus27b]|nr:P-loop containing nucleoside triphosphate hydrolase protein [Mortierella sp. GBAus27b]
MAAGTKDTVIDVSYFEQALKVIRPSGMGEFQSKIPPVTFKNLYGIEDVIADLRVSVIEPFHNPGKYIDMGISPPRGLLIHGVPGVGKTMLCCALAEELGINFMLVEGSQIRSKVVGESEQNIARMFAQAKANAPCILFIDQIDVLAPSRGSTHTSENSGDRIVTGLLTATNRPEVIDSAIMRPGRLDQIVYIPIPDQKTRQAILEGFASKMPLRISVQEMEQLLDSTIGYSGADLENLCREAALICLREDIKNTEVKRTPFSTKDLYNKQLDELY